MQSKKLYSSSSFTDYEFVHINNVVHALQVVKLTVEVLCQRDSNLLTADVALRFMLKKLRAQSQKTALGTGLANALSRRAFTNVGTMNNLSGVILYLLNKEAGEHDEDSNLF